MSSRKIAKFTSFVRLSYGFVRRRKRKVKNGNRSKTHVAFRWKLDERFAVLTVLLSYSFVIFLCCFMREAGSDICIALAEDPAADIAVRWPVLEGVPLPAWVPEDYEIVDVTELWDDIAVVYKNIAGNKIIYKRLSSKTRCYTDAYDELDAPILETVMVHGVQGVYCNYAGINLLIWVQGPCLYQLESAEESKEVLLKMANLFP